MCESGVGKTIEAIGQLCRLDRLDVWVFESLCTSPPRGGQLLCTANGGWWRRSRAWTSSSRSCGSEINTVLKFSPGARSGIMFHRQADTTGVSWSVKPWSGSSPWSAFVLELQGERTSQMFFKLNPIPYVLFLSILFVISVLPFTITSLILLRKKKKKVLSQRYISFVNMCPAANWSHLNSITLRRPLETKHGLLTLAALGALWVPCNISDGFGWKRTTGIQE